MDYRPSVLKRVSKTPAIKIMVKIVLLFFASHSGKKISKLAFVESEYFRAIPVSGQAHLYRRRMIPSPTIMAMAIQV